MKLVDIYRPIQSDLKSMDRVLQESLKERAKSAVVRKMTAYLLKTPGKRIRPALVILSAKASSGVHNSSLTTHKSAKIAAAVELIHMSSLIHDDVIDRADTRYNRPTVNARWGLDLAIALGDYLYSVAFELISECGSADIIRCVSSATRAMCEGELLQVGERRNLNLSKDQYLLIVKKKTAELFAASCRAGALACGVKKKFSGALEGYGRNFGIAFQIVDDYLDLAGSKRQTGKRIGQDILAADITLPMLQLLETTAPKTRKEMKTLFMKKPGEAILKKIKQQLRAGNGRDETKEIAGSFINLAKQKLEIFNDSPYKQSLNGLADYIVARGFDDRSDG